LRRKTIMKPILVTLSFLFILSSSNLSFGQETSLDKWKSLLNKKELATYFSGIFNEMGFVIEETNERFTVSHEGDYFTIKEGIEEDKVDYVVNLKLQNIENMLQHGEDGSVDEFESFQIMSVLFTPLTEASLTNPTLTKPLLRKMSGIENHIHIHLIAPDNSDTVSHTLVYLNKKWMVIPGVHGEAKREFNLTPQNAIDYQRQVFIALNQNNTKGWKTFKKWYIDWREGVSTLLED